MPPAADTQCRRRGLPRAFLRLMYGAAWRLARPLLRRNRRLADGFAWRLVPPAWSGTHPDGRPIDVWIQAASGGEAYLAAELLRRLADGSPLSVLATTWTRQGLEVLHGMAENLRCAHPEISVRVTLFPLDQPALMAQAMDQARPRIIVLLETELWPGLLLSAAARHIPVLVFNGRMTAKSLGRYQQLDRLCPGFWQGLEPRTIMAVSRIDAQRFAALFGESRVSVVPNIKFDRCLPDSAPACTVPEISHTGSPVILLASTREEEEEILMDTVRRLRHPSSGEAPTLIIAPRHLHRVSAWKDRLTALGEKPVLRSSPGSMQAPAGSLLLWDAFGELNTLYASADAVFVGGSLAPLGGQNFLEALAAGRIPCCGPHLENFSWTSDGDPSDTLMAHGLLVLCPDPALLAEKLLEQARNPAPPQQVRQRFLQWLQPRLGGAERCTALLRQSLAGDMKKRKSAPI